MSSVFVFHRGPAGHTGHIEMYSVTQAVIQIKSLWYYEIYSDCN